jgi:alkane 1-monooxygenase
MNNAWSFRYLLSVIPAFLVVGGNMAGGWWALAGAIFIAVLLMAGDQWLPENTEPIPAMKRFFPDAILASHAFFQTAAVASLLYGIYAGLLEGSELRWAVISTGINSGFAGMISAHEMIHRKETTWKKLGVWNLLTVNYAHFIIEHIQGHHRFVGTARDPATARYGENVYFFFIRTVPQQFLSALKIEATRLRRNNQRPFGLANFVVRATLAEILIGLALYYFLGVRALVAFLLQSLIAVFLLEYVNYLEHYGLVREEGKKVNATHSWQSDFAMSRFALIELSRHSDHHITASKPFHQLASHAESPVLPTGYFGSFYLALIPPLWFYVIHKALKKYRGKHLPSAAAP